MMGQTATLILLGSSFYPGLIYPCPWPLPLSSLMTSASISNPAASEILNLWSLALLLYILVLAIFPPKDSLLYLPKQSSSHSPASFLVQPSLHSNTSQNCQAGKNIFSLLFFLYVFVYFFVWSPSGPEECWPGEEWGFSYTYWIKIVRITRWGEKAGGTSESLYECMREIYHFECKLYSWTISLGLNWLVFPPSFI